MPLKASIQRCSSILFRQINYCSKKRCSTLAQTKNSNISNLEFPGAKGKLSLELKFVSDKSYECIPIYHVLGRLGEVVNQNDEPKIANETLLHMYKTMVQLNQMDRILYESQRQGRISFYMTNFGEEGIHVGSASAISTKDILYCQYREAGVFLYRGMSVREMIDQCYGNKDDRGRGRQMPVHYGNKNINIMTISSPLATQLPHAVGSAYVLKRTPNNDRCVVCYFGEGTSSEGDTHAAFNFAATLDCPVIFFCRNNGYAISTPSSEQYRGDGIAGRAAAYGIHVLRVDGTDPLAVHNATKKARDFAISQNKPVLIEAMAYRVGHHSTSDDSTAYRSLEEIESWNAEMNPITKFKAYLQSKNLWSDEHETNEVKQAKSLVLKEMIQAEKVKKPDWREMYEDVYFNMPSNLRNQMQEMEKHVAKYKEHYPVNNYEELDKKVSKK